MPTKFFVGLCFRWLLEIHALSWPLPRQVAVVSVTESPNSGSAFLPSDGEKLYGYISIDEFEPVNPVQSALTQLEVDQLFRNTSESPYFLFLIGANVRSDALDSYDKKPDCFRRAAGVLRTRCGELDMDEAERVNGTLRPFFFPTPHPARDRFSCHLFDALRTRNRKASLTPT